MSECSLKLVKTEVSSGLLEKEELGVGGGERGTVEGVAGTGMGSSDTKLKTSRQ